MTREHDGRWMTCAGRDGARHAIPFDPVVIGHTDYRALVGDPRARLRYLVALFAKDVTVASTHAANEPVLDQMIDVLAHAERNLLKAPR